MRYFPLELLVLYPPLPAASSAAALKAQSEQLERAIRSTFMTKDERDEEESIADERAELLEREEALNKTVEIASATNLARFCGCLDRQT